MADVLHINTPASFPRQLHRRWCHTCSSRTRFAVREYGWYAPTVTCCACGDSWTQGERHQRPFRRGWRKDAIAKAEQTWTEAEQYTEEDREAWIEAELERWSWLT